MFVGEMIEQIITVSRRKQMDEIVRTETHNLSGALYCEEWRLNGQMHRDNDLPAYIQYREDGSIDRCVWRQNGWRHREHDLPAVIDYDKNNLIVSEEWYQRGKRYRVDDLPSYVVYQKSGSVKAQYWYTDTHLHSHLHREHGPASISYLEDGVIILRWYLAGKFQKEIYTYPEPSFEDLVKPSIPSHQMEFALESLSSEE